MIYAVIYANLFFLMRRDCMTVKKYDCQKKYKAE